MTDRVNVFIGSGEASLLERKVLMYSLRKHAQQDLDIYVLNGTHNAIELNDQPPFLAPMSLRAKYCNVTEFSLYRYLIPELCQFQGRAIYVDSDMICLTDISKLFETSLNGCHFLAKRESYAHMGDAFWGLSVMLIDCDRTRFNLEQILDEIDQGLYTYSDFSCMSPAFLAHHSYQIGELDPHWNVFDYWDASTKLIHYTNLLTQPWKHPNHPYGELWFQYLDEAISAGVVSDRDIELSLLRSYVRQDIREGNSPRPVSAPRFATVRPLIRRLKRAVQF
ncbi:lipopolysaccharide biosynthesis protein [Leptolyngbya boryana NIES-2135]|jgi:lipopolysaccharide biosynthesis glycosyltransferase|uniref:Lipopolysaccharide biosynthesis protein n=1 Tax=Leptolyngbya boryana NIES-2135 TaxID=1973484 RepID=A0A1Z4JBF2_LEPBY|nr:MULTISPECIES: glycosyltransferase [Leptolyngbya]BAY54099.1 lipopolysaccharide biosynthesis protein [Leptolyngbya boryana NIES-2135]MBD2369755.1 glycosyl transferase [Leptolyngbya sp. FACHB-161]MBD2376044.1 glycosyl transferase [Leptolyngbya sp. FACHB-238]MBD2400320.1 glycosyl transferase [Leptolyngbya sp. FACHB-239]MBD2406861.1 glycosyl transferase [Leptolyngbya sp. FACHB-402]